MADQAEDPVIATTPVVVDAEKEPKKKEKEKEEPIDLSKPLTKCERPSKEKHEADLLTCNTQIALLETTRSKITAQIDLINGANKGSTELSLARAEFKRLLTEKNIVMAERKIVFDRRDALKSQTDNLIKDAKSAKEGVKYKDIASIEKRIKELHTQQETTSMTITDEKKLIKEIEQLSASKKTVSKLGDKEDAIAASKLGAKDIQVAVKDVNDRLTASNKSLDAQKIINEKLNEKEQGTRVQVPDLLKERDGVRDKISEQKKLVNKLRDEYKKGNNSWYNYQRYIKALKQAEYVAEKEKREKEKEEYLKQKEEEELKKIPYEEEMALCDFLVNYLTITYLTPQSEDVKAAMAPKSEIVIPKEDPFAGFAATNKKVDDVFLKMPKKTTTKLHAKKSPDTKAKAVVVEQKKKFILTTDSFEQFGMINLIPPTSLEAVAGSVEELKAKKAFYQASERGAVKTAKSIIQDAKKKAEKSEKSEEVEAKKESQKSKKAYVFSNDDFAPLTDAAVAAPSAVNADWGKKVEEEEGEIVEPEVAGEFVIESTNEYGEDETAPPASGNVLEMGDFPSIGQTVE